MTRLQLDWNEYPIIRIINVLNIRICFFVSRYLFNVFTCAETKQNCWPLISVLLHATLFGLWCAKRSIETPMLPV